MRQGANSHRRRRGGLRRRLAQAIRVAAALASFSVAQPAEAVEEQWHAGIGAEWALLGHGGLSHNGLGGSLNLTYGLSDAFNLMVQAGATGHEGGDLLVMRGALGAGYVLDILTWVPYAGFLVGAHDVWTVACEVDSDCKHDVHPSVSIPLGLDYQLSRSFAIGATGQLSMLFFGDDGAGSMVNAGLRAQYMWGY